MSVDPDAEAVIEGNDGARGKARGGSDESASVRRRWPAGTSRRSRGRVKAEAFPSGPGKSASSARSLDTDRAEARFPSQATVGPQKGSLRTMAPACPPRLAVPVHLRLRSRFDEATEKLALRAALVAAHLLGLAIGRSLRELRGLNDPLMESKALLKEAELRASIAWDIVDILGARLDKIPERHRPHYTPAHRFRILEIRNFLCWNGEVTARLFRICQNTLSNWEKHADPDSKTVGSTVKPVPPLMRLADVGRSLVQSMLRLGFGGEDLVAQVLLAPAGRSPPAPSVVSEENDSTPLPGRRWQTLPLDRNGQWSLASPTTSG
jgi:hypothetical protein